MTLSEPEAPGKPHQLKVLAPPDGSLDKPFARKNAEVLDLVLRERGVEFRYNLRAHRVERREAILTAAFGEWTPADDHSMANLREAIGDGYFVRTERGPRALLYGRERWADCLDALLHHRKVDPFVVWLEALDKWDGEDRLAPMLSRLFGAPDDDLSRWAGRFVCMGSVQRALEPGCKLDEMPVLVGAQGIGKSALLRCILPPDMPELFGDGLRFDAPAEKRVDAILGKVLVECSEMAGRSRADIESIKYFVSCQNDNSTRRPYAKYTQEHPRRLILVGTTNNTNDLPNDPSGLRRFVPIELEHGSNVELWTGICRTQLWAEALHRYHAGERANLPRYLKPAQAERAEEHRDADVMVEDAIANLPRVDLTLAEVADLLPERLRTISDHRVGRALRNAGWTLKRKRRDAKQVRVWECGV